MRCTALLRELARWGGGAGSEDDALRAFAAAFKANWHAVVLLGATRTSGSLLGCEFVDALRRSHSPGLNVLSPPRPPLLVLHTLTSAWRRVGFGPPGGVEEAIMLACHPFVGWCGQERGDDSESDEESGDEGLEAWPGLAGFAPWICARCIAEPPPPAVGVRADARSSVRKFSEVRSRRVRSCGAGLSWLSCGSILDSCTVV